MCGEVGDKAAECGRKGRRSGGVEVVEEVVADFWCRLDDENGGHRRKGGVDQRKRRQVAFVHKNKFGVLEVDCGDLAVYVVEASAQVHELDVAQVSTEITIDSAAEESVCPQKWAESFWAPSCGQAFEVGECQWRSD